MIYVAILTVVGIWAWLIWEIRNAPEYKDGKFIKRKRK